MGGFQAFLRQNEHVTETALTPSTNRFRRVGGLGFCVRRCRAEMYRGHAPTARTSRHAQSCRLCLHHSPIINQRGSARASRKTARSPRKPSATISKPRQLGVARDSHPSRLQAPSPTRLVAAFILFPLPRRLPASHLLVCPFRFFPFARFLVLPPPPPRPVGRLTALRNAAVAHIRLHFNAPPRPHALFLDLSSLSCATPH